MVESAGQKAGFRKEEVFNILVDEILSNKLAPGDPLVERILAERFGLSRTPIREVLLRLQNEHLVDMFPNQGVFVRKLTPQDVRELFQLREALEPLAARLAAQNRPDDAVSTLLKRFPDEAQEGDLSTQDMAELGRAVHDELVNWAGNKLLKVMYATIRKHTQLVRSMTRAHQDIELLSLKEHRAILLAVEKQDADDAHALTVGHLQRTTRAVTGLILGRE